VVAHARRRGARSAPRRGGAGAPHGPVGPASALAVGWFLPHGADVESDDVAFVLDGLHRAVRIVSPVALTAYYLECRKSKDIKDKAGPAD